MAISIDTLKPAPKNPLPDRLCNIERLLHSMSSRQIDGIVATTDLNVFYLSSFSSIAHKADEPRPYAIIISRHAPEHPVAVIADYYLSCFINQPSWIEDIRPFRAVMMGLDVEPQGKDLEGFIPEDGNNLQWLKNARKHYSFNLNDCLKQSLKDLGLDKGRVAFDDLGFGNRLKLENTEVLDGYDALMFARAVKSEEEIELIRRAQNLNQNAIEHITKNWQPGMDWRELNQAYHLTATALGGFVRDPGAMVWGHPQGTESAHVLQTGIENFEIKRGLHIMFDCHGTIDRYCWDGGKTWVVDGEPEGRAKLYAKATADVAEELLIAMRPGASVSALQALGRNIYRKSGVSESDNTLVFFHGLGLSHIDMEIFKPDGQPNHDWVLEEGMVIPLHLLCPGGDTERYWLEEVAVITADGGRPLFNWGFEPICSN